MAKVRVFTPTVALKDNMADAQALAVSGLAASKVRVGFLDNTKPNCGLLFGYVGEILQEQGIASATLNLDKTDSLGNPASRGATEAVFSRLKENSDFVITGLGN